MKGDVFVGPWGSIYFVEEGDKYVSWSRDCGARAYSGSFDRRTTDTFTFVCTTEELHKALTLIKEKQV